MSAQQQKGRQSVFTNNITILIYNYYTSTLLVVWFLPPNVQLIQLSFFYKKIAGSPHTR